MFHSRNIEVLPKLFILIHLSTSQDCSFPFKEISIPIKKIYIPEYINDLFNPTSLCVCHTSHQNAFCFSPIFHYLWLTLSFLFDYMLFKENRNSCYIKNYFLSMWGSPTTIIFFKPLVLKIILNIEVEFSSLVIPIAHLHFIFQISNYLTVWEVKINLCQAHCQV